MKWLIIMLVVLMPVIGFGEEEGMPGADPSVSGAPEFEQQSDQSAQEPGRESEPAKPVDVTEKVPSTQSDKNVNSGVKFQTIEDLNK